jgi:hypothetical protein
LGFYYYQLLAYFGGQIGDFDLKAWLWQDIKLDGILADMNELRN